MYNNVALEPKLKTLSGEVFQTRSNTMPPEARPDVRRATGFWTRVEDVFFHVRLFHQNVTSNRNKTFVEAAEHHEQLEYKERITVIMIRSAPLPWYSQPLKPLAVFPCVF